MKARYDHRHAVHFVPVLLLVSSACTSGGSPSTSDAGTEAASGGESEASVGDADESESTTSGSAADGNSEGRTSSSTTAPPEEGGSSETTTGSSTGASEGQSTTNNPSAEGTTGDIEGSEAGSDGFDGSEGGDVADETGDAPSGPPVEETVAPLLTPRSEHGVGVIDGEIYVLCGLTPSATTSMEIYSPATDSWRQAADFPVNSHHPNVASIGGMLYVLGFHLDMGQRAGDGRSYVYDPAEDAWSPRTSMPEGTGRGASCVTTFEDRVYVFGGTNDTALTFASYYDPAQDTWHELPPLPIGRHHCLAEEIDGKIYLVSGRDVVIEDVQPESYVFDPVAQTYEEVAPIPTPRGGAAGGVLNGRIYVFGGEGNVDDPMGIFGEVEVYDPGSDTWEALPDMVEPRHGFGGAVIDGRIYLPGGSTRQGILAQTTHSVFYDPSP